MCLSLVSLRSYFLTFWFLLIIHWEKILQRFVSFPCELIVLVPNMNLLQSSRELYTELARVKFYGHWMPIYNRTHSRIEMSVIHVIHRRMLRIIMHHFLSILLRIFLWITQEIALIEFTIVRMVHPKRTRRS